MQRIVDFVSGKLTYVQFEELFTADPTVWDVAQTLLTPEIMNNNNHPFWSKSNRSRLECNNYSVQYACLSFGYDLVGRVITHRLLGELVSYQYPDIVLRDPPDVSTDDLREKIGMDYLGGSEVDSLVDKLVQSKDDTISATKFIQEAKQQLRVLFHLVPRKYPRWIQEPDWPMGKHSPMKYVDQKKRGELVEYFFQDVDTDEMKVVKQYY